MWGSAGPSLSLPREPGGLGSLPASQKPARSPSLKGLALAVWGPDAAGTSWEAFPACLGRLLPAGCLRPWICLASNWMVLGCPPPYRLEERPAEEVCSAPTRQMKTQAGGAHSPQFTQLTGEKAASSDPRLGRPPQEEETGETGPNQSEQAPERRKQASALSSCCTCLGK